MSRSRRAAAASFSALSLSRRCPREVALEIQADRRQQLARRRRLGKQAALDRWNEDDLCSNLHFCGSAVP